MEQKIHFRYFNSQLNIGMFDWKTVYLLKPTLLRLFPEVYKGRLVYRIPGSSIRLSYHKIKRQLIKKPFFIIEHIPF